MPQDIIWKLILAVIGARGAPERLHRYEELVTNHHLKFKRTRQTKSIDDMITGEWVVQGSEKIIVILSMSF